MSKPTATTGKFGQPDTDTETATQEVDIAAETISKQLDQTGVVLCPLFAVISTRQILPRDAAWTPRGFDGINFSPGRFQAFFPPRVGSTRDDVITFILNLSRGFHA